MPSERVQRRIDGLLDRAEEAVEAMDWARALEAARAVLLVDPGNPDAEAFVTMAEGSLVPSGDKPPLPAGEGRGEGEDPSNDDPVGAGSGPPVDRHKSNPPRNASPEALEGRDPRTSGPDGDLPPTSFANGRYTAKDFLGEGGKKRVYLAHDTLLDREVAFALIKTEGLDQSARARITREAQAMGRLGTHPNIVTVFDLGTEGNSPYIVTELMDGGDVEALLASGGNQAVGAGSGPPTRSTSEPRIKPGAGSPPFLGENTLNPPLPTGEGRGEGERASEKTIIPLERAIEIGKAVCEGLQFAHEREIVHRDLKPANVWLTGDGTAKIGDFGLAVMTDRSRLTLEGSMAGTPYYMPPEQAVGGDVTPRADLYSLGAMLYEMVTGRPPFLGDDDIAIIGQHINTAPVAPTWHNGACPRPLEALIMRLLAKDPAERPDSARDVFNALEALDLTARGETVDRENTSLESLAGGVFVGRQDEMDQLKSALEDVLGGSGRLVTLVGEPGIGKTRTSEELATYAALRGATVLWGRCYETGGQPPYWPWVQAIRSYVREADPDELRRQMGSSASVIAEAVEDVSDRLPEIQAPAETDDPESARFRLFDGITSFLKSVSQARPMVIVLDDLHWSDRPSLTFLEFVAREIAQSRLMLVATYRDMELNRRHPLSVTLGDLSRERLFERVLLRGLAESDIGRFIEIASGVTPPAELSMTIRRHTEGNPLFVTEVVRDLVQSGELAENVSSGSATWSVRIPEGVREVIGRRLDRLSERANEVLTIAAVVGRDFHLNILQSLMGPVGSNDVGAGSGPPKGGSLSAPTGDDGSNVPPLPSAGEGRGEGEGVPSRRDAPTRASNIDPISEGQLLDVLDEALDARIIEELSDGIGHYQFTHALMQETLTSEISLTRRVRLHARIAQTLETLYGDDADEHASELAYHFAEAEAVLGSEKLIKYAVVAGEQAMASSGPEEALSNFERAETAMGEAESPLAGRIWFGLGITGAAVFGPSRAQPSWDYIVRGFDWFVENGDTGKAVEVATYPVSIIGSSIGTADLFRRALALVDPDSSDAGWISTRLSISLYSEEDDFVGVREIGTKALAIARKHGDVRMEARAQYGIGFADVIDGDYPAALKSGETTLKLAESLDDAQTAIRGLIVAWPCAVAVGDLAKARILAEKFEDFAARDRDVLWMRVGESNRHDWAWLAGEPTSQVRNMGELHRGQNSFAWRRAETGGRDAVDGLVELLTSAVDAMRPQGLLSDASRYAGMAYTVRADAIWDGLVLAVEVRGAHVEREGRPGSVIALTPLALAAIRTRDEDGARRYFDSIKRLSGFYEPWALISYDRLLGLLAAVFGDTDASDHHFEAALDFSERTGHVREAVWTQMEYAEALLDRDDGADSELRTRAIQLQDAALEKTRELDMGLLTERILERRNILRA